LHSRDLGSKKPGSGCLGTAASAKLPTGHSIQNDVTTSWKKSIRPAASGKSCAAKSQQKRNRQTLI
jgi:hypothetical protein